MVLPLKKCPKIPKVSSGSGHGKALWYQGLSALRQDVHHFSSTHQGRQSEPKKVSRSTRPIYINFFIFIYIYIGRRKVDATSNDAGLGEVRAQDSCGMVGQMSHAPFWVTLPKDLVILLNAPLKATLPTPDRLGLSS